ncbi:hypothetical protein E8E12_000667 [Didymella heteroderae]|uniref:Uncharacterized protein n=1 Tax=Didymella heteroderae TaxID=1769908 RepID=A0A9P5BWF1_9PLEO|nr:hypothetical protein E8E12_000667 [Didymella heteroderae]
MKQQQNLAERQRLKMLQGWKWQQSSRKWLRLTLQGSKKPERWMKGSGMGLKKQQESKKQLGLMSSKRESMNEKLLEQIKNLPQHCSMETGWEPQSKMQQSTKAQRPGADAEGAAEELDARVDDAEGAGWNEVAGADEELGVAELHEGAAEFDDEEILEELGDVLRVKLGDGGVEVDAAFEELADEPDAREAAGDETALEDAGSGEVGICDNTEILKALEKEGAGVEDDAGETNSAPFTRKL